MIDDNSSCKINNRLYKMLSINQPEWDNELFMVKMKDYFEGVVNKCSDFYLLGIVLTIIFPKRLLQGIYMIKLLE